MIKYYTKKKGASARTGPYTLQGIHEEIEAGRLSLDDQFSIDKKNWQLVSNMKGLKSGKGPAEPEIETAYIKKPAMKKDHPAPQQEKAPEPWKEDEVKPSSGATGFAYWQKRPVENQIIKKKAWSATWKDWVVLIVFIPSAYGIYWYVFESGKFGGGQNGVKPAVPARQQASTAQVISDRVQQTKNTIESQGQNIRATASVVQVEAPPAAMPAHDVPSANNASATNLAATAAVEEGRPPLEKNLDVSTINDFVENGMTRLAWAAYDGRLEDVKRLVASGADPDLVDGIHKCSPLHWAIVQKHEDVALYLVEKGVHLNGVDEEQRTPLLQAVVGNLQKTAEVLIKSGAELNSVNRHGETALDWAVSNGNSALEDILRKKGGHSFKELMRVIRFGYVDKAEAIIKSVPGFVKLVSDEGETVLHYAVTCTQKKKSALLIKKLIAAGASLDVVSKEGVTPLLLAVDAKNWDVVDLLLTYEVDVNAGSLDGVPLLHSLLESSENVSLSLLRKVIARGPQQDATNAAGETALHVAIRVGRADVVEELLKSGVSPQQPDAKKRTPLALAKIRNHAGCIEVLEKHGAKMQ